MVFPASAAAFTANNDSVTAVTSITFQGSGYNLTGNALTISSNAGIADTGSNAISLSGAGVTLGVAETISVASGGALAVTSGLVLGNVATALTVTGGGNLLLAGSISGGKAAGQNAIIKGSSASDTGVLTLNNANTFLGITQLNDGIINMQNATALGTTNNLQILGTPRHSRSKVALSMPARFRLSPAAPLKVCPEPTPSPAPSP